MHANHSAVGTVFSRGIHAPAAGRRASAGLSEGQRKEREPRLNLEGSGFSTRAELEGWLAFVRWSAEPASNPDAYSWIGAHGWVPTALVDVRTRPHELAPLAPSSAPRLLTLAEAGQIVRVAPETVRYWIWQGRLQGYKPGRAVLVREDELLALVEAREGRKLRVLNTRRVVSGRKAA